MASSGGTSFRFLKDKIKHSSIGETVTGKINSIMRHDQPPENASPSADPLFHFTPSHHRSASTSSLSSERGSMKDFMSSNVSTDSDKPGAAADLEESGEVGKESQQSDVFEQQLLQLQEQLVSSMIENQNLAAELQTIRNDKQVQKLEKDLSMERKRNNELLAKISGIAQQSTRIQREVEPVAPDEPGTPDEGTDTSNDEEVYRYSLLDTLFHSILQKYYEVVEDFSVTSDDIVQTEVTEPLSVKKLKVNVKRFGTGISPIFDTLSSYYLLFNWHSPLLTGTVFLVYMYACWTGFLLPGLLFALVLRLFLNLLEEWKVIPAMHLLPTVTKPEPEKEKETSVSDKFNIVLDVAAKVQNNLGRMADGLEKLTNLFTWKRPEDTKQIFIPICLLFALSLFLHMDTIVFALGSLIGLKLFIVNPVYDRFPRVKQRYDGTSKLYASLVTDAEMEKQNLRNANNQLVLPKNQTTRAVGESSRQTSTASDLSTVEYTMSEEDRAFCERFHLPDEEKPVPHSAFKGGRHCIYIEKNSPLKLSTAYNKHTKLYLTPSFLCYELVRQDERKAIPLANITRVEKRKPLSVLPGNGMSLEIVEEGFDRPHLFGGLLHRDDCYNTLMEIGRLNELQYTQSHEQVSREIRLSDLADPDDDIVPEPVDSNLLVS